MINDGLIKLGTLHTGGYQWGTMYIYDMNKIYYIENYLFYFKYVFLILKNVTNNTRSYYRWT